MHRKFFVLTFILSLLSLNSFSAEISNEAKAHAMALEAAKNPALFHETIEDITKIGPVGAMTLEMAKFYYAVAAVEFTHCVIQSDGTLCDAFVESLKDPISHIGFAIFMKSNHMTMEMVQIISRGKANSPRLSDQEMKTGMFGLALVVFGSFIYGGDGFFDLAKFANNLIDIGFIFSLIGLTISVLTFSKLLGNSNEPEGKQ